jgi:hypothetical protein
LAEDGLAKRSIEVITSLQEEDGGFLGAAKDDAYPFVSLSAPCRVSPA